MFREIVWPIKNTMDKQINYYWYKQQSHFHQYLKISVTEDSFISKSLSQNNPQNFIQNKACALNPNLVLAYQKYYLVVLLYDIE
jgi:hypothetical protein